MKYNPMYYINKLFDNKKFLMAFSIVCAVIFWLIIDISENPTREVDFPVKVTVSPIQGNDDSDSLTVMGEYQDEVKVTVSGPRYIVSTLKSEDITVKVVSYSHVTKPGTYELELTAKVDNSDCTVVKCTPSKIKVNYDFDTTKEVPVEIDVSALSQFLPGDAKDYEYKSSLINNASPDVKVEMLNVTGPSKITDTISKVVVSPIISTGDTINHLTETFDKVDFKFYDESNNVIEASQLVFDSDAYIRVALYKFVDVALTPQFENLPLCYSSQNGGMPPYKLYYYNAEQKAKSREEVTMYKIKCPIGMADELASTGLKLEPINFMDVTKDHTSIVVQPLFPPNVELVSGTQNIEVALELGTLRTIELKLKSSDIAFEHVPDGMKANPMFVDQTITVTVCYDRSKNTEKEIKAAGNVLLKVDLSGVTSASIVEGLPITVVTKDATIFAWANKIEPATTTVNVAAN